MLIGEGIEYLPYFVLGFEEMGRVGIGPHHGRFRVDAVVADDLGSGLTIFRGNDRTFINAIPRIDSTALNSINCAADRLQVRFVTPVRLQQRGQLVNVIDFPLFLRALLRRYSWLSALYCDTRPDLSYGKILEAAGEIALASSNLVWCEMERYSYRQERHLKMGGLMGTIMLEGCLEPYLPLLKLGEYLHIGKGTAFGLGMYRLTFPVCDAPIVKAL